MQRHSQDSSRPRSDLSVLMPPRVMLWRRQSPRQSNAPVFPPSRDPKVSFSTNSPFRYNIPANKHKADFLCVRTILNELPFFVLFAEFCPAVLTIAGLLFVPCVTPTHFFHLPASCVQDCVCVYVCVFVCVYLYICVCLYLCSCACIFICVCLYLSRDRQRQTDRKRER